MNQKLSLVIFLFSSISILSQNANRSSVNGNTAKLYVAFSSEFKFDHSSSYIEQAELFVPKLKHILQQMNFSLIKFDLVDFKFGFCKVFMLK